jgi:DNA-binding transcriptional MerR regulator
MLTIAEIAKRLDQPESTIRSWRDKYDDFIPSAGDGRKRRYKDGALQVFQSIAVMAAEGLTARDIAERLSGSHTRVIEIRSNNSSSTAVLHNAELTRSMQRMADALDMMARQQLENDQLRRTIEEMNARIKALEERPPEVKPLPWYKRIGRKL